MKQKITSLFCALLLVALTACGAGTNENTETAAEHIETTADTTAETLPSESAETEETREAPDTTAPLFLSFTSEVTLGRGEEFDLHRYISYADDLDPEVELTVEGGVDTGTVGDYPLTLTLTDDAGNAFTSSLTVRIKEPEPSGDPKVTLSSTKSFSDFAASYKTEETMVGIDVSRWQGAVDFNKVAAAGCEFVIIRMGGYSDGVFEDRCFAENIKNAKAAGLLVGVYWYSEETGADHVREDADYLYSLLNGAELDFPIFFDWEDYRHFEDYKMSLRDLNEMFLAFRAEAEARGYRAALYNSKYYLELIWSEEVKEGGVWLAQYVDGATYKGSYFLWQQGFGRIPGINGDVDVNVFYPGAVPID